MKTSSAGRALIERREGRRLSAYRDSRGIWTIGVGHAATGLPPTPFAGMTISEAECDALLAADLAPIEAAINAAVKVPICQNEFDALASLGFNIGAGGLRRSTVIKRLNLGDVTGAADAFLAWSRPAVLAGRRKAERAQFLAPDPPIAAGVSRSHTVAAARSTALTLKAADVKRQAKTSVLGGAVAAGAGSTATAAAAAGGHHYWPWILGGIFAVGAVLDGIATVRRVQTAATLSTNAAAQSAQVAALASAGVSQTPSLAEPSQVQPSRVQPSQAQPIKV